MTIHDIQQLVCTRYGISHCDLMSRRRGRLQAVPRQVAMWLSRHTLPHTLPEIGRAFDRDHSTVIQAIRRVDERMAADADFAGTVWTILQAVDPVESVEIRRMRMRAVA